VLGIEWGNSSGMSRVQILRAGSLAKIRLGLGAAISEGVNGHEGMAVCFAEEGVPAADR